MKALCVVLFSVFNCVYAQSIKFNIDPIIDYSNVPLELRERIQTLSPIINDVSKSFEIDINLLVSVAWTESHFVKKARSYKGAMGVMQVMPKTRSYILKKMGKEFNKILTKNLSSHYDYKEIEDIIIGSYYIKYLLIKFDSNLDHAIMAYNMGPKWVKKKLKNNQIIGNNNQYLNKVKSKMILLASK